MGILMRSCKTSQRFNQKIAMKDSPWTEQWFNEDYLKLYASRGEDEAESNAESIIKTLSLKGTEKLLDVGCGAGRHVLAFKKRGFLIEGLDASSVLIREAKRIAKKLNLPGSIFHLGDIRTASNLGEYDVLLSLFTSFGYFEENENLNVLKAMRQKTRSSGTLFMDYLNPPYVIDHLKSSEELILEGERVSIKRSILGNVVEKKICFPKKEYIERVRLYSLGEITTLLQKGGFKRTEVFGNYRGDAYGPSSERMILISIAV